MRAVHARHNSRIAPPELQPVAPIDDARPERALGHLAGASAADVLAAMTEHGVGVSTVRAADRLLTYLEAHSGGTWHERWHDAIEETGPTGRAWLYPILRRDLGPSQAGVYHDALRWFVSLDLLRPSYVWMNRRRLQCWPDVARFRDPDSWKAFEAKVAELGLVPVSAAAVRTTAAQLVVQTGKPIQQITADDVLEMARSYSDRRTINGKRIAAVWQALRELGWLQDSSIRLPTMHGHRRQRTPEQMVDRYGIPEPQRSVLVQYLKGRQAALDYTSLDTLSFHLGKLFCADVTRHYGPMEGFALTREQAEAWKGRVKLREDGKPRAHYKVVLNAVRAFYTDITVWAQHDAYWAQWAAPTFIYAHDTAGMTKDRRRVVSAQHHKVRQLAPVLPQIVTAAEAALALARAQLAEATAVGDGGTIRIDDEAWEVIQVAPESHVRIRRDGAQRDLTDREDAAFWAWAAVEMLRHSGVRVEELLELTHLSLQPYTIPQTGEVIPLLHIAPSKSDEERLLVAGPELAHAAAQVVARVRSTNGQVPLVQRYDTHERTFSEPLPFLFQGRQKGGRPGVISPGGIRKLIQGVVSSAGIRVAGRPIKLTPHDFRRIFATDALASGMPPHIIQQLMGHKSIVTTQGYAAIYPQHVIAEHQSFIAKRREVRPSDEYRQPTAEEWDEFERHFVTRRVELGTCGRAYGSGCRHEHACIRCSLLRPDPAQKQRLATITTNLRDRIKEAEANGWLGEVEGLQTSLAAAEAKLDQMDEIARRLAQAPAQLPMPVIRLSPERS